MQALERVGIVEKAYVRASNLSGGQQQRVGIARALAQEPTILLADEPVASLDPPTSHVVMRDLQRINRELGITTIVNLHFLDLAKVYGERIIGLRDGELVYDGTGAQADEHVFRDIYGRSLTADDVMGEATTSRSRHDAAAGAEPPTRQAARARSPSPAGIVAFLVITAALGQRAVRHRPRHRAISPAASLAGPASSRELLNPNWAFLPRTHRAAARDVPDGGRRIGDRLRRGVADRVPGLARHRAEPFRRSCSTRSVLSVDPGDPGHPLRARLRGRRRRRAAAGIAALVLFNLGVVAKLLSETVDGVDPGPIEAARAAGANRTQTVRWAVLPQVLPNYVAFSLYAFELNIRASTVIGIVGAGGHRATCSSPSTASSTGATSRSSSSSCSCFVLVIELRLDPAAAEAGVTAATVTARRGPSVRRS